MVYKTTLCIYLYHYSYHNQEACQPDSSPIYDWFSGLRKLTKVKFSQVEVGSNITHLASRKSYQVSFIICPNSYEKLTKSEIKSSWSWFEHCSYLVIICPQFMWKVGQKCNQVKLESVRTLLKITHLASRKYGNYLPPIHMKSWSK